MFIHTLQLQLAIPSRSSFMTFIGQCSDYRACTCSMRVRIRTTKTKTTATSMTVTRIMMAGTTVMNVSCSEPQALQRLAQGLAANLSSGCSELSWRRAVVAVVSSEPWSKGLHIRNLDHGSSSVQNVHGFKWQSAIDTRTQEERE